METQTEAASLVETLEEIVVAYSEEAHPVEAFSETAALGYLETKINKEDCLETREGCSVDQITDSNNPLEGYLVDLEVKKGKGLC